MRRAGAQDAGFRGDGGCAVTAVVTPVRSTAPGEA